MTKNKRTKAQPIDRVTQIPPNTKTGMNSVAPEWYTVPVTHMTLVMLLTYFVKVLFTYNHTVIFNVLRRSGVFVIK